MNISAEGHSKLMEDLGVTKEESYLCGSRTRFLNNDITHLVGDS